MRRVVITGLGIVSSIGNDAAEVAESLKLGRSGISFAPEYAERGFRSQVHGKPKLVRFGSRGTAPSPREPPARWSRIGPGRPPPMRSPTCRNAARSSSNPARRSTRG